MNLELYLSDWETNYRNKLNTLPLFDFQWTQSWNSKQKKLFAQAFQHVRGHCAEFFWHIGSFVPDPEIKKIVLDNIKEEFGENNKTSHSILYSLFAKELGCDLMNEIGNQSTYISFIKNFNLGHLKWLSENDIDSKFAAFSAYEKLDNADYNNLYQLAKSLGVSNKQSLLFFEVHMYVEHFDATTKKLKHIWDKSPNKVEEAFQFIGNHQLRVWKNLGEFIMNNEN